MKNAEAWQSMIEDKVLLLAWLRWTIEQTQVRATTKQAKNEKNLIMEQHQHNFWKLVVYRLPTYYYAIFVKPQQW